jgi:hypothetical protein
LLSLGYGKVASAASTFVHCLVGTPARFTPPVIIELESQNKSTLLPPMRVKSRPALTSMLDKLANTKPP